MQRNIFYLYTVWFFILVIVVVVAVNYSFGNKKTSVAVPSPFPSPSITINNDQPLKKVPIKGFDRVVVTGTVDDLSLDTNTGKYTLSMLLNTSKILVELGSPQYHHLVLYSMPKGEKNTIEEVLTMGSIAPLLTKGKKVEIEVSLNPEIEGFLDTFDTKRDKIFKIVLPGVISIKI